jgi:hypothetical protein
MFHTGFHQWWALALSVSASERTNPKIDGASAPQIQLLISACQSPKKTQMGLTIWDMSGLH